MGKLIETIPLPQGLRALQPDQLTQVAHELRDELIEVISAEGGHFASSLGATEITVALHHLFNTPHDRIVWDTGHQAYVHKMVTGRLDRLQTIRKRGGLSGFLKQSESEFDSFGAGHAGTSISAAVGMAAALTKTYPERKVVAVIGDGSMTAGMAFEALNHAGAMGLNNLIVVLNDNEMSISPNVGAISWLFSKAVTSKTSNIVRERFKNWHRQGYVPEIVYKVIDKAEEMTQGFFSGAAVLFEGFGFRYIGPVDGHNLSDLITALTHAKEQNVPVLVHAYTSKGHGYEPAEADPIKWHAVTPFNRSAGQILPAKASVVREAPSYTSVFASTVTELMKKEERLVAITAAMLTGTGLDKVQGVFPERVYDVGIAEQHAVTFAAGLACEGVKPICAIYSTFLQRGYDQVVHDVCIQNLPVVFALDRGGVVGNDGETHQGVFDIGFLRALPHMVVMSPKDENEFRHMLFTAVHHDGPIAVRYPRGSGSGVEFERDFRLLPLGKGEILREGHDLLLIAFGPVVQTALRVAERLEQELGLSTTVINARFAKPLDEELLAREIPAHAVVATIEDHAVIGGFGSSVSEFIQRAGIPLHSPLLMHGVQDAFVPHASQSEQHAMNGYDATGIYASVAKRLRELGKIPTVLSAVA